MRMSRKLVTFYLLALLAAGLTNTILSNPEDEQEAPLDPEERKIHHTKIPKAEKEQRVPQDPEEKQHHLSHQIKSLLEGIEKVKTDYEHTFHTSKGPDFLSIDFLLFWIRGETPG